MTAHWACNQISAEILIGRCGKMAHNGQKIAGRFMAKDAIKQGWNTNWASYIRSNAKWCCSSSIKSTLKWQKNRIISNWLSKSTQNSRFQTHLSSRWTACCSAGIKWILSSAGDFVNWFPARAKFRGVRDQEWNAASCFDVGHGFAIGRCYVALSSKGSNAVWHACNSQIANRLTDLVIVGANK